MRVRMLASVLLLGAMCGLAPGAPALGEHAAFMELPAEYRAWFRNPDGSCIAADTPISTSQGDVPISQLQPQRHAIYYLAADGRVRSTHHYHVFPTRRVANLTVLQASDGRQLRLTPDHRVGVGNAAGPSVRYVAASKLKPGDPLASLPDQQALAVASVQEQRLAAAEEVWDIQLGEPGWEGEGNFFASGILIHNCVQCSNGMVGMHINRPEWTFLLWDTPYGSAVRGGSWPGRVANYARQRGMRIFNVTGNSYEDTRPWMLWAAQTNRFCAIGAGRSHFQTLYGYVPGDPRPWKVCNNNSTSRIDEYSEDEFRRLHLASGPWVIVPDEPAPAPPPRLVEWWR